MTRIALPLLIVLVLCSSEPTLAAQTGSSGGQGGDAGSGSCPDVAATLVKASVESSGNTTRCGLGVSIFGFGFGLFGPQCPDFKFIYPAHGECRNQKSEGTYCKPGQAIPVQKEKCSCGSATILGTGLKLPSCNCLPDGTAGSVQDAITVLCQRS